MSLYSVNRLMGRKNWKGVIVLSPPSCGTTLSQSLERFQANEPFNYLHRLLRNWIVLRLRGFCSIVQLRLVLLMTAE